MSQPFCYVHDVPPTTDEETALIDEGRIDECCIWVVRVDERGAQ